MDFPQNNVLGATPGPSWAIAAGWFYLIRPLPPSQHVIRTAVTLFGSVVRFHYNIRVTR